MRGQWPRLLSSRRVCSGASPRRRPVPVLVPDAQVANLRLNNATRCVTAQPSSVTGSAVSVEALVLPTGQLPDFLSPAEAKAFSFGAIPAAALSSRLQLFCAVPIPAAAALYAAASAAAALHDALLADVPHHQPISLFGQSSLCPSTSTGYHRKNLLSSRSAEDRAPFTMK
eukprot:6205590-Pleurochrysis_carterae.AAC.4